MAKELVSIIMPCYNASKYVRETVNSVLMQSYTNWELILVNDCSSDNTLDIIYELEKSDSRIIVLNNSENMGGARTRNVAIDIARGRYIAFLDSDDLWVKNKLETQISFMKSEKVGFTYSNYTPFIDSSDQVLSPIVSPKTVTYDRLLANNIIGCLTVVYDVTFYGKFHFPISKKRHDFALWLKMLRKFNTAYNVGYDLAQYRIHSNSLSSKKSDAFQSYFNVLYRFEGFSYFKSLYYTTLCALITILKKKKPRVYRWLFRRGY